MDVFALLGALPPYLEIRLKGTARVWHNATPRLSMIGGQIWLSYGIENMDCVLFERADTNAELVRAVLHFSAELAGKEVLEVDSVFLNGAIFKGK